MRIVLSLVLCLVLMNCGQVPIEGPSRVDISKLAEGSESRACSQLVLEHNTVLFYCDTNDYFGIGQVQRTAVALSVFRREHRDLEPLTASFHETGALLVTFRDKRSSF